MEAEITELSQCQAAASASASASYPVPSVSSQRLVDKEDGWMNAENHGGHGVNDEFETGG